MDNQANTSSPSASQVVVSANQTANVPPRRSSNSKWVLFGLLAIFIVGVASAGAYMLGAKNNQQAQTSIAVSPTVSQPSTASDEVNNWKTYTNTQYSFSFDYPAAWMYGEQVKDEVVYPLLNVYLRPLSPTSADKTYGLITVEVYNHGYSTLQEFLNSICDFKAGQCSKMEDITISNLPGKKIINPPSPVESEIVVFKNGKDIYRVRVALDKSYEGKFSIEDKKKIFNQILFTFKFTQ